MNEIDKNRYVDLKCRVIYWELKDFFDMMRACDLKIVRIRADDRKDLILADIENVDTKEKKTIVFYDADFDSIFRRKLKYKDIVTVENKMDKERKL